MTEEQIKKMVDEFLRWRLPDDFRPDNGISFDPFTMSKEQWPIGTNLFTADQAEQMIRHILSKAVAEKK